jgi:PAT family beta-lactamase induction signal transducer AmpG
MIASSAGALYLAQYFGWFWAYAGMAALVLVGMVTVLMTREPAVPAARPEARGRLALVEPFRDFARRPAWIAILVFVLLYKFGDALAGSGYVTGPLYLTLGFTKVEIANITKVLGVAASIGGVVLGGMVVYRAGVMGALLICGILQMLSNLMYVVQLWAGHDVGMLALTISVENVTGGMSSAAFVAYLSQLCSPGFAATQYALLSAIAALARTVFASAGGALVERLGWAPFFFLATAACLPGLLLLLWLMRRRPIAPESSALAA